jgi:hypothetical protein
MNSELPDLIGRAALGIGIGATLAAVVSQTAFAGTVGLATPITSPLTSRSSQRRFRWCVYSSISVAGFNHPSADFDAGTAAPGCSVPLERPSTRSLFALPIPRGIYVARSGPICCGRARTHFLRSIPRGIEAASERPVEMVTASAAVRRFRRSTGPPTGSVTGRRRAILSRDPAQERIAVDR